MGKSRLKSVLLKARRIEVPASFFSMILGLVGLRNCWRVAAEIWHLPIWIGESIYFSLVTPPDQPSFNPQCIELS